LESFTKLSREGPIGVVIKNFNKATPEASNAFLKNLEEPTGNIHYILTAPSIYNILPTITSRCQIIKLTSEDDFQKEIKILKSFLKKTTSGRLEKISNVRKRDEAIDFMEVLIKGAHSALYRESTDLKKASEFIINANYTLNNLNANGNVALQLTNFVVSIA
jgi:DNA polymerase-3 subunit delta'